MDEILFFMKSHPLYEEFEERLLSYRPIVPEYNPKEDNTDEWKYRSAQKAGFDLCLTIFKIEV